MPIGIGVEGAITRRLALRNIDGVTSEKARESLEQIRTHLSKPGRESGILTLYNRTNSGSEMKLERKSGFIWEMDLWLDQRLNDTVHALKTMLTKAGKHDAVIELENYLKSQGGNQNRIESKKMLEILNRHLGTEAPLDGEQDGIEPRDMPEIVNHHLPPEAPSLDGLYKTAKIEKGKELGSGAYGTTFLVNLGGKQQVLKEFEQPQLLTLERNSKPNEAMGSYLTSTKHPNYLTDEVNISQPTTYLVSVKKDEGEQYRMVTPHEMRSLVKDAMKTNSTVMCHGIIMPKAQGEDVRELVRKGLSKTEKKQIVRGTLQSIQGLNKRGFVHRDIKLVNTFFDKKTKTTTLIDTGMLFKTSKNLEKHPGSKFIEGFAGTPGYLHPRGLRGEEYGTETDLYALGVMTLEMDHSRALRLLGDPMLAGYSKEWLLKRIDDKIKEHPKDRAQLEALRDDINNPNSVTGFAMLCIEKARLPAGDWSNRDWAQQTYSELLEHPVLQ